MYIQDCPHRLSLGHPVKGAAGARHGCLDPGLIHVVSTCLRTPTPRPRVLGGPGKSTSSGDGHHHDSASTYPGPRGSCMVTPCGARAHNLRIRSPTPCPLGHRGCGARDSAANHTLSFHVWAIPGPGRTGARHAPGGGTPCGVTGTPVRTSCQAHGEYLCMRSRCDTTTPCAQRLDCIHTCTRTRACDPGRTRHEHDPSKTRPCNLRFRRATPYPLGYRAN